MSEKTRKKPREAQEQGAMTPAGEDSATKVTALKVNTKRADLERQIQSLPTRSIQVSWRPKGLPSLRKEWAEKEKVLYYINEAFSALEASEQMGSEPPLMDKPPTLTFNALSIDTNDSIAQRLMNIGKVMEDSNPRDYNWANAKTILFEASRRLREASEQEGMEALRAKVESWKVSFADKESDSGKLKLMNYAARRAYEGVLDEIDRTSKSP